MKGNGNTLKTEKAIDNIELRKIGLEPVVEEKTNFIKKRIESRR